MPAYLLLTLPKPGFPGLGHLWSTHTATNLFHLPSHVVGAAAGKGATMARVALFVASATFLLATGLQSAILAQSETGPQSAPTAITLPSGSKVDLAVTAPVWARTVKTGDPL